MHKSLPSRKPGRKAVLYLCVAFASCLSLSLLCGQTAFAGEQRQTGHQNFYAGNKYLIARHERHSHTSQARQNTEASQADNSGAEQAASGDGQNAADYNGVSADGADASSGSTEAASGETGSTSGEPPHTLLYYVVTAMGTIIGVTVLLSLISSSSVIFLAGIWHFQKMINGGKKPSIG